MKNKLTTILIAAILLFLPLYGENTVTAKVNKIEIIGPIDGKSVAAFITTFNKFLSDDNTSEINILINSPGGSVYDGTTMIDLLNVAYNRGITVNCYVAGTAASMAFIILSHCENRYVLPHSKLLFHPVSIFLFGVYEIYMIEKYIQQTLETERLIKSKLLYAMGMDEALFETNYQIGTLWHGSELASVTDGFLKVVADIKGFKNLYKTLPVKQMQNYRAVIIPNLNKKDTEINDVKTK